jgi:NAD(P)-dependent dehydrogenase (short-subunit alcohol dehydrogenase family)
MTMGLCEGRTVIVTGAARGLGRAYALAFAAEGANVVVNDIGASLAGEGRDTSAADAVVAEINAGGTGSAIANYEDITDWDAAKRIVDAAVAAFGGLDVVVNNAGIVRDRMFVSATPDEWDATMHVHLRGHFCVSRHAVDYWRGQQKAGNPVDARIINTTSGAGLQGSIAQAVRHHGQRPRSRRAHANDRTGLRREDGNRSGGVRRHGSRQCRADGGLAGERRQRACHRLRL